MIVGNTFINRTITATIVNQIIIIGYIDAFFTFHSISCDSSKLVAISSRVCTMFQVISVDLISSISSELKKYDCVSMASARDDHSVNLSIISLMIKSIHLLFSHCWRDFKEEYHSCWRTLWSSLSFRS